MVFESLVTEVLNRFLGSYIENLDTKQLNIGIWGGDVVLKNLSIKSTALSDLDLPIKLYQGHLGKLTLKIPWKNLYAAPVIATIDSLFILLVPNSVVKYDERAEEKGKQEIKQKELEKIEEAKRKQELAKAESGTKQDTFVEKLVSQIIKNLQIKITGIHLRYEDTFSNPEKPFAFGVTLNYLSFDTTNEDWKPCIATQAIKMIYKIVRLDALSLYWNSDMPSHSSFIHLNRDDVMKEFRNGIAHSSQLTKETTSSNTNLQPNKQSEIQLSSSTARKDETLQISERSFPLSYEKSPECILENANKTEFLPPGYSYILRPLTSLAQLRLNPKPELDGSNFSTPKMLLNLIIQGISIGLSQFQYQDVLELLESLETLNLKSKYRKYRPHLQVYKDNYEKWWHFAMTSVMEVIVRPKLRQWSWKHISAHRELVREYSEAYKIKLTTKKLPLDVKNTLDEAERQLDVFNITLARQKAALEVKRLEVNRSTSNANAGWLGGWFSWGSSSDNKKTSDLDPKNAGIAAKFNEAMSPEERKKLYQAIDYTESGVPPEYPREFVQNVYHFKLLQLSLTLFTKEDTIDNRLTEMVLNGLGVTFEQCPGADASQLEVSMDNFDVSGKSNPHQTNPLIIKTIKSDENENLVHCLFESNPLDNSCDQRLHLTANPLQIVYDAGTINKLSEFFKPPESVKLKQLQNAAVSTLEDVKQNTATGYKYALEKRKILDLKVNIKSSHIIIPNRGVYKDDSDIILIDLGNFSMFSVKDDPDVRQDLSIYDTRSSLVPTINNKEIEDLMEKSYDKVEVKMDRIQMLYATKDDDWKHHKSMDDSPLHILKPGAIKVLLEKSIIMDDPKIPRIRIFGVLPDVTLDISDKRLEDVLKLILSVPRPQPAPQNIDNETIFPSESAPHSPSPQDVLLKKGAKSSSDNNAHASDALRLAEEEVINTAIDEDSDRSKKVNEQANLNVHLTSLMLNFELKLLRLNLYRVKAGVPRIKPKGDEVDSIKPSKDKERIMSFSINSLGAYVESKTFETLIKAHLKAIVLENFEYAEPSGHLYLINSSAGIDQHFLSCKIIIANINGPDFVTEYCMTEKRLDLKFCPLNLKLHQKALLTLLKMGEALIAEMTRISLIDAQEKHTKFQDETRLQTVSTKGSFKKKRMGISFDEGSLGHSLQSQKKLTQGKMSVSPSALSTFSSSINQNYTTPPSSIKPRDSNMSILSTTSPVPSKLAPLVMTPRKNKNGVKVTDMFIQVNIQSVSLNICDVSLDLATISIIGLKSNVMTRRDKTQIDAELADISIQDNTFLSRKPSNDIPYYHGQILGSILTNYRPSSSAYASPTNETLASPSYNRKAFGESPNFKTPSKLITSESLVKATLYLFNNGPNNDFWKQNPSFQGFYRRNILYDINKTDIKVDVTLGGLRVVVLLPFFARLQSVIETFSSDAKSKMAEATSAAAAEVASNLSKTASRILLRVEMRAPVFVIPRGNSFPDAAILDLGTLRLANRFALTPPALLKQKVPNDSHSINNSLDDEITLKSLKNYDAQGTSPAIMDKMMLELTDFKISRVIMDETNTSNIKAEVMILEPANINLEIRRNLSFEEHNSIPEIDITGHLSKVHTGFTPKVDSTNTNYEDYSEVKGIEISLSEDDLNTVMNIVNENLSAKSPSVDDSSQFNKQDKQDIVGSMATPKSQQKPKSSRLSTENIAAQTINLRKSLMLGPIVEERKSLKSESRKSKSGKDNKETPGTGDKKSVSPVKISFKFQFDKVAAALYYGSSNLSKGGVCERDSKKALSRIQLIYIHLTGHMKSDNSLDTKISLYDLSLEDKRPLFQSGITKMIEMRKINEPELINHTISPDSEHHGKMSHLINFEFLKDANSNMTINAAINKLYACVCIDFLRSVGDFFTKNMPSSENDVNKPIAKARSAVQATQTDKTTKEQIAVDSKTTPSIYIRFSLNEPEIILIEDPLDWNTKALILTLQLGFLYDRTPDKTLMDGKLHKLQIIACPFPKHLREGNTAQILNPLNVIVTCDSLTKLGQKILAQVSDIVLNISPATIRVLTAVTSIKGPPKPAETEEDLLALPENLWAIKDLSTCDYWFLHTELGDEALDSLSMETKALSDEAREDELLLQQQQLLQQENLYSETPEGSEEDSQYEKEKYMEQIDLSINSILITIEAGVDNRTVPMIKTQCKILTAKLQDWSGKQMKARLKLSLEAGYYNEYLALWEPLIEPLVSHDDQAEYVPEAGIYRSDKVQRPWELTIDLKNNPDYLEEERDTEPTSPIAPSDSKSNNALMRAEELAHLPSTYIEITSKDLLNLTFTKCCLQMLNNLSTAFKDAVNQKEPKMKSEDLNSPYVVINSLGAEVYVEPDRNLKFDTPAKHRTLLNGQTVNLFLASQDSDFIYKTGAKISYDKKTKDGSPTLNRKNKNGRSSFLSNEKSQDNFLDLKFPENDSAYRRIAINQVRKIFLELPINQGGELKYQGVIVEITSVYGCKKIIIQSPLKLINYFSVPIEIFIFKSKQNSLTKLITLATDQQWSVPIHMVYTYARFYFKPSNEPYDVSKDGVDWKNNNNSTTNLKYVISCPPQNPQYEPFYLSITELSESIYGGSENEPIRDFKAARTRTLHIMPTVTLINLLPYTLTHKLSNSNTEVEIKPGDTSALYNACIGKSNIEIKIKNYIDRDWTCSLPLNPAVEEFQVRAFTAPSKRQGGKIYSLDTGFHSFKNKGMMEISLFSPYWMVNQTGLTLFYQQAEAMYNPSPMKKEREEDSPTIVEHKPGHSLPFLFSFKPKAFFSKKKVCIKINDSDWSEKFSLDTVGSSGVLSCKRGDSSYEIGVDIVLSKTGFTKVVTFIPYYTINNKSKLDIMYKEYLAAYPKLEDIQKWQTIAAGDCLPFWPKQSPSNKNMALMAKFKDSDTCTTPFPINRAHNTLLKLDNVYGGINVECHVSEIAATITFDQYYHGQAVILLINQTGDDVLQYYQSGTKVVFKLPPNKSVLYSWQDALQEDKSLVWSCGDKKNQKFDMIKDGFGDLNSAENHHKIYWVSFLDGTQRVLMFTEDLALICIAQQAGELEKVEREIELNIEGVSLSLVDNWKTTREIAYASIISSGEPIWEISSSSFNSAHALSSGNAFKKFNAAMGEYTPTKDTNKSVKFKTLKVKEEAALEKAYQYYSNEYSYGMYGAETNLNLAARYNDILVKSSPNNIFNKSGLFLDFDRMAIVKLKSNNIKNLYSTSDINYFYALKRTFRPGLWIQYKTSPHQVQLHAKMNKLQIDDQLPACTFPVILGLTPLPKSISAESSVPKPFVEASMLRRNSEHSGGVAQVKYFKVLVQETFVRIDQGFIDSAIAFFTETIATSSTSEQISLIHEDFNTDLSTAKQDMVRASADRVMSTGQKVFYDFLHFSPIKIHLSFSLQSNQDGTHYQDENGLTSSMNRDNITAFQQQQQQHSQQSQTRESASSEITISPANSNYPTTPTPGGAQAPALRSAALNFLLQSVGVTLADIDDVVFKLAYFERNYRFYTQAQLTHEVTKHYATQALKQMYVLVLGLDVLGNPFGLIRGLTEGMGDLFYEPYQGAIQGPEEFAQGLALGVRSLFGHTIGGAAGAVSRITGTLGKGLAALTMDQDYQKSRREEMNKRPADLKEGVARGGKGLVMGFYEGVTGIVKKPIEGAKQEGATGFFKGFGKGLVGVVARPTSGVVDFASSSFQGIKRLAENVEEVHRLRPRRYIQKDGVIRPYDYNEAEGYEIFRAVEKGLSEQTYVYHTFLTPDMKNVLILTNESIFMISKGELFGQWVINWSNNWDKVKQPIYSDKLGGIKIEFKGEPKKKKCIQSLMSKDDENFHVIHLKNKNRAEIIIGKINDILENSTQGL
ncbi:intermembrane lipid transfer protein VPS13A-like isoform X3 [Gordionus sp. m RMFG-2023]|uniref:intermembrane lipid transfer protein VPS13A-like isoform X3 n=1 Tax=Gordionus sp. m RMFG-2023 TaxID=3053472 RepID=UPI0031FC0085